ncbi:MAG: sigma 54-interacting transcriptional regulator [Cyanobacteriota bacterium]
METRQPAAAPYLSAACLQRLAPHLVPMVRRGIVGKSRYAQNLNAAIQAAAAAGQARPVLISGEPGLEKDNIAALVHFGSPARHKLMVRLNCALLRPDGSDLFGSGGSGSGAGGGSGGEAVNLLDCLAGGALLLDQIDRAEPALRPALVELARTGNWSAIGGAASEAPGEAAKPRHFEGRVFFTSERSVAELDSICQQIRVPPLRVRRQDLGEWVRYGVRLRSRSLGWSRPPVVSEALIKRLQTYDFPGNVRELMQLVDRALRQCASGHPAELPEDVFWIQRRSQRARFDLWRWKPQLRSWMRSPRFWNFLLFGLVSWVFVLVNVWLWLGPQDRQHNGALNFFWAWWWPLILLGYPLVGRLWCSFCPFMVWGEIVQRLARALGLPSERWPRGETDRWAAPVLAGGFAAILLWEAVGDLENSAWQSSALLLLITAGAVISSLRFEKRFWCRYLCPVGGMNGLFAKLAISELRAQAGTCSGSCSSYACFKGGPAEGEGLATAGCPLGTHPAHLTDNRNCVLCLTCVQACPHRSVSLRLRPPAADLQRDMQPPAGEAGLLLVLAGGLCLHSWSKLLGGLPLAPPSLTAGPLLGRLAFGALALALPAAVMLLARAVAGPSRQRALNLGLYALLPLLWAALLAQHLGLGMAEAGLVLPVSLSPWWPETAARLPAWSADPHVIGFCQTLVLLVGVGGSVLLLRRLLRQAWRPWLLVSLVPLALGLGSRWLVGVG